jgi:hypothetical protein
MYNSNNCHNSDEPRTQTTSHFVQVTCTILARSVCILLQCGVRPNKQAAVSFKTSSSFLIRIAIFQWMIKEGKKITCACGVYQI